MSREVATYAFDQRSHMSDNASAALTSEDPPEPIRCFVVDGLDNCLDGKVENVWKASEHNRMSALNVFKSKLLAGDGTASSSSLVNRLHVESFAECIPSFCRCLKHYHR